MSDKITTGEKPGYRRGMDHMTGKLIEAGMPREKARKQARESAIRADRRSRGQGNPRRKPGQER